MLASNNPILYADDGNAEVYTLTILSPAFTLIVSLDTTLFEISNILIVTVCAVSLLTFIATSLVTNGDCNLIPTTLFILNSELATGGCGVDDGAGNINRTMVIPSVGTTVRYCWDMCLYACNGSGANVTEGSISNLVVSPNPATDVTTFAFETNENNATVTLFDLSGKTVAEQTAVTGASNQIEMNTANLMAGYYIYSVKAGDDVVTGKLMKK